MTKLYSSTVYISLTFDFNSPSRSNFPWWHFFTRLGGMWDPLQEISDSVTPGIRLDPSHWDPSHPRQSEDPLHGFNPIDLLPAFKTLSKIVVLYKRKRRGLILMEGLISFCGIHSIQTTIYAFKID